VIIFFTGGAEMYSTFPASLAVSVTVPVPVNFRELPVRIAGPDTANETGSPELAVALSMIVKPNVAVLGGLNLID
jgi:hypothetical protein